MALLMFLPLPFIPIVFWLLVFVAALQGRVGFFILSLAEGRNDASILFPLAALARSEMSDDAFTTLLFFGGDGASSSVDITFNESFMGRPDDVTPTTFCFFF